MATSISKSSRTSSATLSTTANDLARPADDQRLVEANKQLADLRAQHKELGVAFERAKKIAASDMTPTQAAALAMVDGTKAPPTAKELETQLATVGAAIALADRRERDLRDKVNVEMAGPVRDIQQRHLVAIARTCRAFIEACEAEREFKQAVRERGYGPNVFHRVDAPAFLQREIPRLKYFLTVLQDNGIEP
jgi:hypothetical protein